MKQSKSKLRKNLRLNQVPQNLTDADSIARFLGVSLNALYLRMHFDNFPQGKKINGKLYFDLNAVLDFYKTPQEQEAYCWLVRDEIRTLIDTGKITRKRIGELLEAKNPSVTGGAVYLRPLGEDRSKLLEEKLSAIGLKPEFSKTQSFAEQKNKRVKYSLGIWEQIVTLIEESRLSCDQIGRWLGAAQPQTVGKSVAANGPSYKVAKFIQLGILQAGL